MTKYTKQQNKAGLDAALKAWDVAGTDNPQGKTKVKHGSGICGRVIHESVPRFKNIKTEKVIANKHNASIVLGRDRPGDPCSGYGGSAHTHCASIDMVAGRMSYLAREQNDDGRKIHVDPSFKADAARIYVSQKTDVDKNFELCKGTLPVANTRSAIALKADGVRIIAREGIKLVSGVDRINSQGGDISRGAYGINLIGGNDDSDMQPIPKGDNLREILDRMIHHQDKINGIMFSFLMSQMQYNMALGTHTHVSPFFAIPVTPSPNLAPWTAKVLTEQLVHSARGLFFNQLNLTFLKLTYLSPLGGKYINSGYNYTN